VTESLSGLTKILEMRFADKHRIEIRNRRRKPDETLQSLHIDTRRLAALAFPDIDHRTREIISCDYFLDALADPEFALKIRERHPEDLDSALRIAVQLEVRTKDSNGLRQTERRNEQQKEPKKTREVTTAKTSSLERTNEVLQRELDEQRKRLAELEQQFVNKPMPRLFAEATNNQRISCWRCSGVGHIIKDCPTKPAPSEERTRTYDTRKELPKDVRPINEKQVKTCIKVRFRHYSLSELLDTGSDISIAGNEAARKYKWEIHLHPIKTVKIANGETMITYGAARIPIHVGKRKVDSEILISPGMNGLIIGIDWLEKQGQFVWDFRENRIKFKDNEWLKLQKEDETKRVRRVYVSEDTLLPAS